MLATIELDDAATVVDLDDPATLTAEHLRPSTVATRHRKTTQGYAASLFESHPGAVALRWWSALEASWTHLSIFDQAAGRLDLASVVALTADLREVIEAAVFLGLLG